MEKKSVLLRGERCQGGKKRREKASLLFGPPPRLALEQGSIQPSPPVNTSPAQQLWPRHLSAHTVPCQP
ncbi:limbic system-associated membrane protein-like protein [Lates japonicus]|uniref:Limbic system-associated membrane protein-like protein n=1 Tax=Lates japonicus TaxID=270547 RepID=A0AAD3N603_LATJO|nr:limbic system-associated membrane protein-like protein [Lates japonicus]